MSGGVDSSVSALLLKKQYSEVIGVFMQNWDPGDESGDSYTCPIAEDYKYAKTVSDELDIPLHKVDFVQDYWNKVFEPFIAKFQQGGTPNPDVFCNKEIKFKTFAEFVRKEFGEDSHIATGHYANLRPDDNGNPLLIKAKDQTKDQTYFLSAVASNDFRNVVFPVGNMLKTDVRLLAKEAGLSSAAKKDSVGICFVGKRKFSDFISEYVEPLPGRLIGVNGEDYGSHESVHHFTIGQNAKLSGMSEKMYVSHKDMTTGNLTVVLGAEHPALYYKGFTVAHMYWVARSLPEQLLIEGVLECECKIRHRQEPMMARVRLDGDIYVVDLPNTGKAITSQQVCAFYIGDVCLGGGVIHEGIRV